MKGSVKALLLFYIDTMNRFTLSKKERLCSRTLTKELFQSGSSFIEYPVRVTFKQIPEQSVHGQVLISVPKKRFKRAVDRNRLKRLIREAYRLNKTTLSEIWEQEGKYFALAFVYIGNDIANFSQLNEAMQKITKKLSRT